ncbi:MAG TPA: hypothetical protein VM287_05220 [Egibacteraceae bacterium]|nr:hypothetical protein [Egibacteraceae bacterium]
MLRLLGRGDASATSCVNLAEIEAGLRNPCAHQPLRVAEAQSLAMWEGRRMVLMRTLAVVAAILGLGLALAACGDASGPEGEPVATASPSPTRAPEPAPAPEPIPEPEPDPLAIPDDPAAIDEAYLLGVLNALFAAETERTRHQLTTRTRDDEWHAWLVALYNPEGRDFQIGFFDQLEQNWDLFRPVEEMEDMTVGEVTQVISAGPDCVLVEATYRSGAILTGEPEWEPLHVGLVPHHGEADPARNPTPWWFVRRSTYAEGAEPDNPCA